ncbi:hypothetical protein fgpv_064 [Flamingopox virus FGPVKD09]|uniref:Uncharacterized protein n=1 Tax=Flamingopox virus FGPVKD09 TaxID=2059380 RepID=A0A2H4X276_9POXV|nr:hypothetical protein C1178_gp064 [Flamingopox virus FGPVKD09]AUD40167.1 hypothetical protein fgpv_064 [Flamingopox virus FGPVKD09]WCB86915.1 CPPV104 hypothetical protein [Cooks petrelpox virus]
MESNCIVFTLNDYSSDDYKKIKSLDYYYLILDKDSDSSPRTMSGYLELKSGIPCSIVENINPQISYKKLQGNKDSLRISKKDIIDSFKSKGCYEEYRSRRLDLSIFDYYK